MLGLSCVNCLITDPKLTTGLTLDSNKCTMLSGLSNYVQYRNSCYSIVDGPKASFTDAEQICQKSGAHLVSIVDLVEEGFLNYYLSQNGKSDQYWLGLKPTVELSPDNNLMNTTQSYEWTDGWPLYYTNWGRLEPKLPTKPEDLCVYFNRTGGMWFTTSCNEDTRAYICKASADKPPNFDDIDQNGVCPTLDDNSDPSLAWVNLHKGTPYCFWFSTERKGIVGTTGLMSYSDSAFQCRRRNGTLVSIHSDHVQKLIMNRLSSKITNFITWIGLSRNPSGNY